jgi:hypothetical protein
MRRWRKLNAVHHGDPSLQKIKIVVPPLYVLTIETLDKVGASNIHINMI